MTHAELIHQTRQRIGATGPDPVTERVNADGTLAKQYDADGCRLTDCCGAFATYVDNALVCRRCFETVGAGEGDGTEYRGRA